MLVLYNSQPTGNSYKVRLLLSLLQLPYAAIEVDIFNGGKQNSRIPEHQSARQGASTKARGRKHTDGIKCYSFLPRQRNRILSGRPAASGTSAAVDVL